MNILIIYPFLLHSKARHGSAVKVLRLIRALKDLGHQITLLSLSESDPHPFEHEIGALEEICDEVQIFRWLPLPPWLKLARFLSPGIPPHARNLVIPEAIDWLRSRTSLDDIDVVYMELTCSGEYRRAVSRSEIPVVLSADNLDARTYRLAQRLPLSPVKRLHAWITERRMRNYEAHLFRSVSQVIAITEEERRFILEMCPELKIEILPPIADRTRYIIPNTEQQDRILFFGSFMHHANREGLDWFLSMVFPEIVRRHPNVVMTVVGVGAPGFLSKHNLANLEVYDYVDDLEIQIDQATLVVSPIISGGGARMKNLEALLAGKPLVTTALGAEGLAERKGYLVVSSAQEFAEACIWLLNDQEARHKMGRAGKELIEKFHLASIVGKRFEEILQGVVALSSQFSMENKASGGGVS